MRPKRRTQSIESLANQQAARWTLRSGSTGPRPPGPCVAISRLPASGGEEIAQQVAETLDYGLFGNEIVSQIAREKGIGSWLVTGLDERVRSSIDRFITDAFRTRAFTEDDYVQEVTRIIATLGERGMSVIVGRGAPFILPPDRALRVLVVAPRPARIECLARRRNLEPERAAQILAREDEARRQFLLHSFGARQDDPLRYDLVLNPGLLGREPAARLIVDALGQRFPGRTASG